MVTLNHYSVHVTNYFAQCQSKGSTITGALVWSSKIWRRGMRKKWKRRENKIQKKLVQQYSHIRHKQFCIGIGWKPGILVGYTKMQTYITHIFLSHYMYINKYVWTRHRRLMLFLLFFFCCFTSSPCAFVRALAQFSVEVQYFFGAFALRYVCSTLPLYYSCLDAYLLAFCRIVMDKSMRTANVLV